MIGYKDLKKFRIIDSFRSSVRSTAHYAIHLQFDIGANGFEIRAVNGYIGKRTTVL
jgi:hypothetical protein